MPNTIPELHRYTGTSLLRCIACYSGGTAVNVLAAIGLCLRGGLGQVYLELADDEFELVRMPLQCLFHDNLPQ